MLAYITKRIEDVDGTMLLFACSQPFKSTLVFVVVVAMIVGVRTSSLLRIVVRAVGQQFHVRERATSAEQEPLSPGNHGIN